MTTTVFHPATLQLLRLQSRGRRRRMWRRFCQPRRLVLSAIACILAVAWLGNVAMTIWLRERASPETLRALLSVGLAFYVGWHFAKAAFFRPEVPFDWTASERELLAAMPLRSRDLVAYQLASVTMTTFLKSALFTILLWPDLRCVPLGLVGVLLAMMMLETLRMAVEIATWGMGRSTFLAYRVLVVTALVAIGLTVTADFVRSDPFADQTGAGVGPFRYLLHILLHLNTTVFSHASLPFQPFIDLILAEAITPTEIGMAAVALGMVTALAAAVVHLYAATTRRVAHRERRDYRAEGAARDLLADRTRNDARRTLRAASQESLRSIPHFWGAGALAWRQLIGVRRHGGTVLTAMIAPAVLACCPCFAIADPYLAFLSTTGALAFYTILLLPAALRFDFRRDLERLATLKSLPITPAAAAIGQTLAPVLIATLFQCGVLGFALSVRSLPGHYLFATMLVMIPLNVLVFGLDNLIYLLYPHRMQQEGLEIFLRTMLTFTGKGLLFALGLAVMSGWGLAAAVLTRGIAHWTGIAINAYAVFTGGMIAGPSLLAALVLLILFQTYSNLNPIEDVPR
jgi:hypothetical protein